MEEHSPRHEPLFEDDLPDFPLAQPSRLFDFVFGDDSEQPGTDWDDLFAQDSQQEPTAVPIQTTQIDSSAAQLSWEDQETQVNPPQPAAPREVTVQPDDPDLPPVTISIEFLHSIAHLNGREAADHLGLTRNQFTGACYRLGIPLWNTYRRQAVPHDVRKARERQELFKKTHFQVGEIGARPLSSDAWNFQSQATLNNPRTLAPQEMSQEDMEIIQLIEADCGPAMDWTSGIQEMMMPDGQQSYEPCAPLSFASVVAVEDAFESFPTVVDPTTEKRRGGRTAHAYNEWCIAMSYYMFKYVTHDFDAISKKTGMNKFSLQRLKQPHDKNFANYKAKFQNMSKSELKDHISTLEKQKHISLKLKVLTFFDIVNIWNLFVDDHTPDQINAKLQIPISTVKAICKRSRHSKITNYFPLDRMLDLQWFKINWPKNADIHIISFNGPKQTKFTNAFFYSHPEFKAVYDERQKVNFVVVHEQKYGSLSSSEKLLKSLFPTLPYPSDWEPPHCPAPVQTNNDAKNETDTQLTETFQQPGETFDDLQEMEMDTDSEISAVTFKLPENIRKRKIKSQQIVYDKYSICYAYYLRKHLGIKATSVSEKSGVDFRLIYNLHYNKSQLYQDYIDEIKDMGKEELEKFLSEISAEPRDSEPLSNAVHAPNVKIDEHCYALSYYMSKFEHKGFTEIIQATGISQEALKRLLSDNSRFSTTIKKKLQSMSKLELETYISNSKEISYKFFNRESTTIDKIVTIWNMRLEKMSFTEISRRINLPIPTVNYICIGKRQSKITQYFPLDRRLDPSWFEMHWTELSKSCIVINHSVTQTNFVNILLESHPEFKAVQRSRLAAGPSTEIHTGPLISSSLPLFPTSGYSPSCISAIREMLMDMPAMTEKDPLVYINIQPEPQAKIPRLQHGETEMVENPVMTREELRVDTAQHSVDPIESSVDLD